MQKKTGTADSAKVRLGTASRAQEAVRVNDETGRSRDANFSPTNTTISPISWTEKNAPNLHTIQRYAAIPVLVGGLITAGVKMGVYARVHSASYDITSDKSLSANGRRNLHLIASAQETGSCDSAIILHNIDSANNNDPSLKYVSYTEDLNIDTRFSPNLDGIYGFVCGDGLRYENLEKAWRATTVDQLLVDAGLKQGDLASWNAQGVINSRYKDGSFSLLIAGEYLKRSYNSKSLPLPSKSSRYTSTPEQLKVATIDRSGLESYAHAASIAPNKETLSAMSANCSSSIIFNKGMVGEETLQGIENLAREFNLNLQVINHAHSPHSEPQFLASHCGRTLQASSQADAGVMASNLVKTALKQSLSSGKGRHTASRAPALTACNI